MKLRFALIAFVALCLVPAATSAQTVSVTTGGVNGVVVDSTGGALPGATVTATSLETGFTRSAVTDSAGVYAITLLPPGKYRVDAELSGLGKAGAPNVDVLLGSSTKVDIKITPQVAETVDVVATSPIIDASRSATAMSVTNEQIQNLPILGRDFRSLALLTPGVTESFGSRVTANGARGVATDYNIDGATSNNDFFGENTGGTRAPFTFSQAAIKEFQVVRSQYDAEFSRGVGAQVNAITKSGTNDFSGQLFLFFRDREWAGERSRTLRNGQTVVDSFRARDSSQPGFAIGGPIVRNKTFFFGSFDAQRQKLPIEANDIRTFSNFQALSPALQEQFFTKLESILGHPYEDELRYDQSFDQNSYLGKVDFNFGPNFRLSVRDNYTVFDNRNNQTLNNHLSNQGLEEDKFNQFVTQATMILSTNLVNTLLFQALHDERPINPTSLGPELQIGGIVSGSNVFLLQNDALPNNTKENKFQVKNTLQYARGRHTFKAGTELLFMNIDNLFARNQNGVFRYSSVQAFVDGVTNTFLQGYGPGSGLTTWGQDTFAFFGTDTWRVNSRLTLDLGIRYDWQTMPKPTTNVFPQHPEFVDQISVDRDNVAGRFGFAYDLLGDGSTVLRGGTGQFFGYMPDILLSNPLTQISGNFNQITLTCATATTVRCPTYPNLLTPDEFNQLARVSTDIVTVSPDYEAQQAWRSSIQLERQVTRGITVGVGGIFAQLSKVQGSRNINAVPSGIMLGNVPHYVLNSPNRKYTDMGVVRELCSCEEASFKSFTIETHKLAVGGSKWSWDLSYTLSDSTDYESNERSTSSSFLYDPFNPALSEGPSDNDIRHRVVGNATYTLPWDIMLSGIFTWRSGLPYTGGIAFRQSGVPGSPTSLSGLSQTTGNIPVFVNANGDIIDLLLANNMSRQQFADFLASQDARIIGRNTYRQPDWYNIDFRISKTFDLKYGRTRLQLLAEVFNIMNTKNEFVSSSNQNLFEAFYTQSTDRYTFTRFSNFGLTNSYSNTPDPRQFQVAVKVIF